ncbi:MAG: redox-regulated ATPase YchF [Pseudomonadota bacterium]
MKKCMGFNCGIVGLPNVGKSTIFNALTAQHVPAESYPFCTTDHNTGVVSVPDVRLDDIAKIFKPDRVVNTHIEFVDIAGLVAGAHKGEGLGNKFLGNIRNVDAIAHVVRCFENPDIPHQYESVDPVRDVGVVETEMMLADLEIINKQLDRILKSAKSGDKRIKHQLEQMGILKQTLEEGRLLKNCAGIIHELKIEGVEIATITDKPVFFIANIGESELNDGGPALKALEAFCNKRSDQLLKISAEIEEEIADLPAGERAAYRKELGIEHSSLEEIIRAGYSLLNLVTFFTKESSEVKAWTVESGTKAPQAAGKIHTDFEKGFVKAIVYNYSELMKFNDEHVLKEKGLLRIEGHDYIVRDGDIIQFRFAN